MHTYMRTLIIFQIRLLFNRKNKTLRSVLMTRSVLKLLEENRKTIQSLNNNNKNNTTAHPPTTIPPSFSSSTASAMDHDNTVTTSTNNATVDTRHDERTVQEIIEDILEQEQWRNQRASKLDLDDFLSLLVEFNSHGIHFS